MGGEQMCGAVGSSFLLYWWYVLFSPVQFLNTSSLCQVYFTSVFLPILFFSCRVPSLLTTTTYVSSWRR